MKKSSLKKLGEFLIFTGLIAFMIFIICVVNSNYQYNKYHKSYWELAERASTIQENSIQIDKFVASYDTLQFKGKYNAVFLTTESNSFNGNFRALKTLQSRLNQIKTMNPTTFEYQTAIQQITAQEQNGAEDMLSEIYGIWYKENYPLLWDWIGFTLISMFIIIFIFGVVIWNEYSYIRT